MAHHVALVKLHEAHTLDALQDLHSVEQAASPSRREIDLRDVSVDHHFRVEALPREDHLHLFGRAVLCLVDDDEAVVERASAHERDGSDLDDVALEQFFHALGLEHVEQRVVERAQIGIDLFLQRARQEAETLARFHRGPRQDDARHLLVDERGNGHGDGEIGLAGAGRAHAEDQVVAFDGLEVASLVH